jgi:hypothetical protein
MSHAATDRTAPAAREALEPGAAFCLRHGLEEAAQQELGLQALTGIGFEVWRPRRSGLCAWPLLEPLPDHLGHQLLHDAEDALVFQQLLGNRIVGVLGLMTMSVKASLKSPIANCSSLLFRAWAASFSFLAR